MKPIAFFSILLHSTMLLSAVNSFSVRSVQFGRRSAAQRGASFHGASVGSFCRSSFASVSPPAAAAPTAAFSDRRWKQQSSSTTRRWLSSAPTEGETSVVETCRGKIAAALETDDVTVIGAYDDPNGSHISIEVTSALFEGKRPVQRQQLVYKALWEELKGAVHAVDSMVCQTPAEKK